MTFHALIIYNIVVVCDFFLNSDFVFDFGLNLSEIQRVNIWLSLKGFHNRLLLSESSDAAAVALYADGAELRTPIVRFVPDVGKDIKFIVFAASKIAPLFFILR